jgi:DMSO reductase family type II enzyme chaperone
MSKQAATTLASQPGVGEQVDLYRLFAFVFATPTPERFEWLQQPTLENALKLLWMELGCEGKFPGLASFADLQDYESTYLALFDVGLPQPPVPLQESAHYKALPAQQIALENTQFYEVLGLRADTSKYAPDHLVTQLEFLGAVRYARENASNGENQQGLARLERDFIDRHLLNWLPAAEQKLKEHGPPIFSLLLTLVRRFVRRQRDSLGSQR